jgi:anti-anti-sigma regulatory factor
MLRIERAGDAQQASTLRLEGRVVGPWVEELRRSCDEALDGGARLILDLGAVSFVDRDGLALLRDLPHDRVELHRCSPFLAEQLKAWR